MIVFEHEHLNTSTSPPQWEGAEVEGLIPGRKFRPDGVLYENGTITTVFFFHGNLWHGVKRVQTRQSTLPFPPSPSRPRHLKPHTLPQDFHPTTSSTTPRLLSLSAQRRTAITGLSTPRSATTERCTI